MYGFSETGTSAELNPKIPADRRRAMAELLANDGLGSSTVVSDLLGYLEKGEIQVTDLTIRQFHLNAAPYSAVQSGSFDVVPSLVRSSCAVFGSVEDLPSALMANLIKSMQNGNAAKEKTHPDGLVSRTRSREIFLPLLG